MNYSYYKSIAFRDSDNDILRIKYSAKYFCCNVMSYGDIYYLHQLRRSHCLFDRVLFTRARNLYLITRSSCVAQQIKKTWRVKTSRTEYAAKANRIFEKATICGIKEKALILQQPAYAKTVNLCIQLYTAFVHVIILIIYAIMKMIDFFGNNIC